MAEAYLRGAAAPHAQVDAWVRAELRQRYRGISHEHDDLCQVVHEKLLTRLHAGGFSGPSLYAYVIGIVHHVAIDRLRVLYRERDRGVVASPTTEAPDPYAVLASRDRSRLLHRAVLELPAACRELWYLVLVEKLGYQAIAERMAIPAGTVKSRMFNCRRQLQQTLERLERRGRERRGRALEMGDEEKR
jgi:RNA polymerase sigma-70 factor (ECF subfamily)